MAVEYDKNKNLENIKKHGISFEAINSFQWNIVYTTEDIRHDYGEECFISYGFIEQRLHVLVWTLRAPHPKKGQYPRRTKDAVLCHYERPTLKKGSIQEELAML